MMMIGFSINLTYPSKNKLEVNYLANSSKEIRNKRHFSPYRVATIKSINKLYGNQKKQMDKNKLTINKKDNNLIEIEIIIDI